MAAFRQAATNVKYAGYGAAIVAGDEAIKGLTPEDDETGTADANESQANAAAEAAAIGRANAAAARGVERADAYSANFNMLYGDDADGRMYPWS